MIKNLKKIIYFIIGAICILVYLNFVFKPKNNTAEAGMKEISAHAILSEPKNTIDVLFFGNSLVYSSVSPNEMWQDYGISAQVVATPGQQLYKTYTYLNLALKTQKPKLIVLEIDPIFGRSSIMGGIKSELKRYFPLLENHDHWKNLRWEDFYKKPHYTYDDIYKGYKFSSFIDPVNGEIKKKPSKMTETAAIYLDMIVNKCEKEGISLMFISVPSVINWNEERANTFKKVLEKYPYDFLNFNEIDIGIDWQKDTRDKGDHLNYYGAVKVSHYLAQYLVDNFDLKDRRNDGKYALRNDDFNKYIKKVEKDLNSDTAFEDDFRVKDED